MPSSHLEESHPGDRLLACVMSSVIGNVWCKYQRACAPEKCPLRFLVPGSFYTVRTLLVRLRVLQIT